MDVISTEIEETIVTEKEKVNVIVCEVPSDDPVDEEVDEATKAAFENIYDDIYEVILPSTLWGVHRDPDHQFIAFSLFDLATMSTSKVLHVSNAFESRAYLYNQLISNDKLKDLTVDILTNILSDMDEYQVCVSVKDHRNASDCQVLAVDGKFCANCVEQ